MSKLNVNAAALQQLDRRALQEFDESIERNLQRAIEQKRREEEEAKRKKARKKRKAASSSSN